MIGRGMRFAASVLVASATSAGMAHAVGSMRFYGHGGEPGDGFVFPDRVVIAIEPHRPADVGATDFTIEFWMNADPDDNTNPAQSCGEGIAWVNGNILVDRDRYNRGRKYGIALLDGRVAFGASNEFVDYTLCGDTNVLDNAWHHIAVQRRVSDGQMTIFVDGGLDAVSPPGSSPAGDMSYPDGSAPGSFCHPDGGGGSSPCPSDLTLVFGAEKHGFDGICYNGFLDEVRLSTTIRYAGSFTPPTSPFTADGATAALYHLDEGAGDVVGDDSGAAGGPSNGTRQFGGEGTPGPVWSPNTPFDLVSVSPAAVAPLRFSIAPSVVGASALLTFELELPSDVRLDVLTPAGRLVDRRSIGARSHGVHAIEWQPRTLEGHALAPGVYFLRLSAGETERVRRITLVE